MNKHPVITGALAILAPPCMAALKLSRKLQLVITGFDLKRLRAPVDKTVLLLLNRKIH
jgi:hypothetical protein